MRGGALLVFVGAGGASRAGQTWIERMHGLVNLLRGAKTCWLFCWSRLCAASDLGKFGLMFAVARHVRPTYMLLKSLNFSCLLAGCGARHVRVSRRSSDAGKVRVFIRSLSRPLCCSMLRHMTAGPWANTPAWALDMRGSALLVFVSAGGASRAGQTTNGHELR